MCISDQPRMWASSTTWSWNSCSRRRGGLTAHIPSMKVRSRLGLLIRSRSIVLQADAPRRYEPCSCHFLRGRAGWEVPAFTRTWLTPLPSAAANVVIHPAPLPRRCLYVQPEPDLASVQPCLGDGHVLRLLLDADAAEALELAGNGGRAALTAARRSAPLPMPARRALAIVRALV